MKRMFLLAFMLALLAVMLALLAGVIGGYAWGTQATDDQMNYQSSHGQSPPRLPERKLGSLLSNANEAALLSRLSSIAPPPWTARLGNWPSAAAPS